MWVTEKLRFPPYSASTHGQRRLWKWGSLLWLVPQWGCADCGSEGPSCDWYLSGAVQIVELRAPPVTGTSVGLCRLWKWGPLLWLELQWGCADCGIEGPSCGWNFSGAVQIVELRAPPVTGTSVGLCRLWNWGPLLWLELQWGCADFGIEGPSCDWYLSGAAEICPWDTLACCWDVKQIRPWDTLACCWDVKQICPWDTLACCWDVKQIHPWDTLACCWDVKQICPWDTLTCCWDVKQIHPWDTVACCWDVKQIRPWYTLACCWDVKQIRPWDTLACCWDVKQIRPWDTLACCWDVKQIRPWDTLACCWDVKQIHPWDTLACCWDVKQPTNNNPQACWRRRRIDEPESGPESADLWAGARKGWPAWVRAWVSWCVGWGKEGLTSLSQGLSQLMCGLGQGRADQPESGPESADVWAGARKGWPAWVRAWVSWSVGWGKEGLTSLSQGLSQLMCVLGQGRADQPESGPESADVCAGARKGWPAWVRAWVSWCVGWGKEGLTSLSQGLSQLMCVLGQGRVDQPESGPESADVCAGARKGWPAWVSWCVGWGKEGLTSLSQGLSQLMCVLGQGRADQPESGPESADVWAGARKGWPAWVSWCVGWGKEGLTSLSQGPSQLMCGLGQGRADQPESADVWAGARKGWPAWVSWCVCWGKERLTSLSQSLSQLMCVLGQGRADQPESEPESADVCAGATHCTTMSTHTSPASRQYLLTYLCPSLPVEHRPSTTPAIALCSGLLLSFRTSWSTAVSALLQCLASNCCEAGLSSSSPSGSRSGLGVWCWMLTSWGCVRSSPTSSAVSAWPLVPVPLAPTVLHFGSSPAIGSSRQCWSANFTDVLGFSFQAVVYGIFLSQSSGVFLFSFFSFFFCIPQLDLWSSPFWDESFACVTVFYPNHWGSHIPSSWMVHAGCIFVAGIRLSRTWMSGSFESLWWNACVHRLGLGLYSHPKEFLENGIRTHVNSKGKIPSTRKKIFSVEDQTHNPASSGTGSPTHYQWAIPTPRYFLWVLSVLPSSFNKLILDRLNATELLSLLQDVWSAFPC